MDLKFFGRFSFLWVGALFFAQLSFGQVPQSEKDALIALYNATGGDNWINKTNWLSAEPVEDWYGVEVLDDHVTRIELYNNQLIGLIPSELQHLTELNHLDLGSNSLSGGIPSALGELELLTRLLLFDNALEGTLPSLFSQLVNLEHLILNENNLSGQVPAVIGELTNLKVLLLNNNTFTGSIPDFLALLTNLETLSFSDNELTGEIPLSITTLPNLRDLVLVRNNLTGSLPAEIGDLANLEQLWLSENQLTGEFPVEIAQCTKLKWLWINNNMFVGEVPFSILGLSELESLYLVDNSFSTIPNLTSLPFLTQLELFGNYFGFDDIIPNAASVTSEYYFQKHFEAEDVNYVIGDPMSVEFDFYHPDNIYVWYKNGLVLPGVSTNQLNIPISSASDAGLYQLVVSNPALPDLTIRTEEFPIDYSSSELDRQALIEIYNATAGESWHISSNWLTAAPLSEWFGVTVENGRVTGIDLRHNNLIGELPAEISNLSRLLTINLQGNQISNDVSDLFTFLQGSTQLGTLDLNDNSLHGAIPANVQALDLLYYMYLSSNQIVGPLPPEIGEMESLSELVLSFNNIDGSIPSEITNLEGIYVVDFTSNQLTGGIPANIHQMQSLVHLRLSQNKLSGQLEPALADLPELYNLELNSNEFSGSIPSNFGNFAKLEKLNLHGNQLTGSIPPGLFSVGTLEHLILSHNKLSGEITAEVSGLTNLIDMNLTFNDLSGQLPEEIGALQNIKWLYLAMNNFTGTIPESVGQLANLEILSLQENNFSGDIPGNITLLPNLGWLSVTSNEFVNLPDFSSTSIQLGVSDNYLTFEDLEPNALAVGMNHWYQKKVPVESDVTINDGDDLILHVSVGGTANSYKWVRNDIEIEGATSDTYTVPNADIGDNGVYRLIISNSIVTGNLIVTEDFIVTVNAEPKSYYWVENGGTWDDLSHWATESNGATKHTREPTVLDDVIFDSNSFSLPDQIVEVPDDGDTKGASFRNMDWSQVTNDPTFKVIANKSVNSGASGSWFTPNTVGGSLVLSENMTLDFDGCEFYFVGVNPYTIDMANHNLGHNSYLALNDSWRYSPIGEGDGPATFESDVEATYVLIDRGEMITDGHKITAYTLFGSFASFIPTPVTFNISNSIIETSGWVISPDVTLVDNNATIKLLDNGGSVTFDGKNFDYHHVVNDAEILKINGSNTFQTLELKEGQTIELESGSTQTIGNLETNGSPTQLVTIQSTIDGQEAFFSKNDGEIIVDWVSLKDNHAIGGATFTATHSTDLGNVSGWNFDCTISAEILATQETCEGTDDAMITIVPAPNSGNLMYQLDDGPFQSEAFFDNLTPDTYQIIVKDDFGCEEEYLVEIEPKINATWYADADNDGLGDPSVSQVSCTKPTGYVDNFDDCDDTDAELPIIWFEDLDDDGFGDPDVSQIACSQPFRFVSNDQDCAPSDPFINPGQEDIAGSGIDANCDGLYVWFTDQDGDGYAGQNTISSSNASPGTGEFGDDLDCDDADATLKPETQWFADTDGDGFGDPDEVLVSCLAPSGYVLNNEDCDPSNGSIHPNSLDIAGSGVDGNCDGLFTWYMDDDGDGYAGEATLTSTNQIAVEGEYSESIDCNDADVDVFPGAPALPDGKDNDCDGTLDKAMQVINFTPIENITHNSANSVFVVATASSALPVSANVEGPATIDGDEITILDAGMVTVNMTQEGNDKYESAQNEKFSFCVLPNPTIVSEQESSGIMKLISNYVDGNHWFLDGEPLEGANGPTLLAEKSGLYSLHVSIDGCDGKSLELQVVIASLDLFANGTIDVFPNPVSNELNLSLTQSLNGYSIRLIDMTGREMLRQELKLSQRLVQLNVQELNRGVYQLIVENGQEVSVMKVMKE